MDTNHAAGTFFGAAIASYKSIIAMFLTFGLSPELLLQSAILALLGGAVGWCGAEIMKLIKLGVKKLIEKLFKKNDKED